MSSSLMPPGCQSNSQTLNKNSFLFRHDVIYQFKNNSYMKRLFVLLLILSPFYVFSQHDSSAQTIHKSIGPSDKPMYFGIKAGLNFSNITNASQIGASSRTGWHAGVFMNTGSKLFSFRLELLYSQQGYNFSTDSSSGSLTHNYIYLASLMGINVTKFLQIQIGAQTGYLLNATATGKSQSTGNATADQILSLYNRFDYGFGGGIEVHPIMGLLVGARYNISFNNLYKDVLNNSSSGSYSAPSVNFKNNVVQIFAGWRF
ncbi:MAG: hypothetical protein C5B59_06440 [Bacteroidetes bacterium]|nr:MAG: hypothetical protein C5B59_06440 [Bacteroidota bacterium]